MNKLNVVVLFSGGIDSYAGYLKAKETHPDANIIPMYIDYEGTGCDKELHYANLLVNDLRLVKGVFNFSGKETGDHSFLYARNLYFVTYASQFADIIYLCGLKNSEMLDNVPDFYVKASNVVSQVKGKAATVVSPFSHLEKEEVIDWMFKRFGQIIGRMIAKTTSCYHPDRQFCWNCPNCFYFVCATWKYRDLIPLHIQFNNPDILRYYSDLAGKEELPPKRTESIKHLWNYYK